MRTKFKSIMFTDKRQDGEPYRRGGASFFMLHLLCEDGKWVSRFYRKIEENPTTKIELNKEYELEYVQKGDYYNIVSLKTIDWNIII